MNSGVVQSSAKSSAAAVCSAGPASAKLLIRAFEHSTVGIALQTAEGKWIEVNPAFCSMLGMTREDLIGRSFVELTHPEDVEPSMHKLARLKRGEIDSFRFDKRYLHAEGHEVWVRLDVSTMRGADGRPELIIIQAQDMTVSRQIRAQLAANEARLHSILRSIGEGLMVFDPDGRVTLVNDVAAEILGRSIAQLSANGVATLRDAFIDADGNRVAADVLLMRRTLDSGQSQRGVVVGIRRPDESPRWIELNTEPVRASGSGAIEAVVATFSDITERLRTERALQESEQRLSLAAEAARVGMWDWHIAERRFEFSPVAARMLGYRADEVAAEINSVRALVHPDDQKSLTATMQPHLDGSIPFLEADLRMRQKSGDYLWVNMRGRVTERSDDGRALRMTGTVVDISERKRLEARLTELATTDELTGVLNRRAGTAALERELERARRQRAPLSLLLFDIDHFKSINDRFGHETGDHVLRQVGELLRGHCRRLDAAARWGGEEFALMLPGADLDAASDIAATLLARMRELRLPDGQSLSASFGAAQWQDGENVSDLVRRADQLMYLAKQSGRGRIQRAPAA